MTPQKPLIHPSLEVILASYMQNPNHAVLLHGVNGVGLATIARYMATAGILQSFIEPIKKTTGKVDEQTGTISVDVIRDLYEQMRARKSQTQFAIIDNADRMTASAQSAFLKLLEEPTARTAFILTSHFPSQLLDTVRSRLQPIAVQPVPNSLMSDYEQSLASDPQAIRQLHFIAAGRPALMKRIVDDKDELDNRKNIMLDAQKVLKSNSYDRYRIAYDYGVSQEKALQLIDAMITIIKSSLVAKASQRHIIWLDQLTHCEIMIKRGAKPRLELICSML